MTIRPYEKKDREAVRYVCLNSDGPCDLREASQHFILTTYCDYYIEREPCNCFVATDDTDRAIGYIICAEDFDSFMKVFMAEYLPRIPEEEELLRFYAKTSALVQEKFKKDYPAHFHIDILPDYQKKGLGRRLTDTLITHLRNKNVPGIILSVGTGNEGGKAFYEKYGFSHLASFPEGEAYAISLK